MIRFLALLLCVVTALMGCHRSTTVILPPETVPTGTSEKASGTAATEPSSLADTVPTMSLSTDPTGSITVDPTNAPASAPTTAPTTSYPTVPPAEPSQDATSHPTEDPTDTPTTEPTAAPSTEPATTPTAEPTTLPTTEPTAPTSEPMTMPATEPTTEPTEEPTAHPIYDISSHTVGSLEYSLLDAINNQRTAAELPGLTMDHTLCALGAIRAYECVDSFSHTRPDGRGAFTVISDHGYWIWSHLDERIHHGTSGLSAGTIVKGWMYNADFSANILSADFTHIGIGVYDNSGTTYIVCFFAG